MKTLIALLVPLLIQVESGGNNQAVGDGGNAVGCLQIWKIVVDDCNRIQSDEVFTYSDRLSRPKSIRMAQIYLTHYGKHYERTTGKKVTMEILARNYNGNPVNGYKNPKTLKYWQKIEKILKKGK